MAKTGMKGAKPSMEASAAMRASTTKPANAMKKAAIDGRKHGNQVWCAVECGSLKGGIKTHADGTKRSVFHWLPKSTKAPGGKPRGVESIKKVFVAHVRRKGALVADGWNPTAKAVRELGYRMPPPAVHARHLRDPATVYHTNDAEAEIKRIKGWIRKKYSRLGARTGQGADPDEPNPVPEARVDEFVFLKNVGSDIDTAMAASRFKNGGAQSARDI